MQVTEVDALLKEWFEFWRNDLMCNDSREQFHKMLQLFGCDTIFSGQVAAAAHESWYKYLQVRYRTL